MSQSIAADRSAEGDRAEPLVRLRNVRKYFPVQSSALVRGEQEYVHAVDSVDLDIRRGETLGLVGETVAASRPWPGASRGSTTSPRAPSSSRDVTSPLYHVAR